VLARTWPSAVAGLAAAALLLWLAFHEGGYFPTGYLPAAAGAWGLCGLLLLVRSPAYRLSTEALVGLGALAGLVAWTALSTAWSSSPVAGLEDAQRNATYLGLLGLGVLAGGSGRLSGAVVRLIGLAATAVVVAALLYRLLPGDGPGYVLRYRLDHPLTYWNALGALAAMTTVLAAGMAGSRREHAAVRAFAAAAALLAVVALYLTFSRGAWAALAVGVVVLLVATPRRVATSGSLLLVAALSAVAIARVRTFPALVEDPLLGAGRAAEGESFLVELLGLALLAAAAQAAGSLLAARVADRYRTRLRSARPYLVGAVVALGAVALVGGVAAGGVGATGDAVERQWDDFRGAGSAGSGAARLGSLEGPRSEIYDVALAGWSDAPLAGEGAGSFRIRWARERTIDENLLNAHSLYLEALDELGLIGLLLVLALIGSFVAAAVRGIRRPAGLTAATAAAVSAATAVWVVHAGVDWDWQMPALTGTALVLAATLYPVGRRRRRPAPPVAARRRTWRRWASAAVASRALGAGCLLLTVQLALVAGDAGAVRDGREAVREGRYADAERAVRGVDREPAAFEALVVRAYAARGRGDHRAAERAFAAAVRRSPNDWALRRERAENLLTLRRPAAARRQIALARALNPRMPLPAGFAER